MSEDFKPGTRPLLRLAGLDAPGAYVSRAEEAHAIWSAVMALMLRLYQEPDAQARRESGPTDSQVVAALRVSLSDHFGAEAADYASWALVRYGCRQKPTMAALQAWEGLMFEWQQRRATAPRIALMLRDAGLDKPLASAALESIDRWVADPASALGEATAIIEALFGDRLVSYDLRDDGSAPAHDTLFGGLVASLLPQARLSRLSQAPQRGGGAAWQVQYTFEDAAGSFEARPKGGVMDVDAVMVAVDDLLARIGRPERVYRLAPGRDNNGEAGAFVVADGVRFPEIAWRLRMPLLRSPSLSQLSPGVPTAAPEPLRVGARPLPPRPPAPAAPVAPAAAAPSTAYQDTAPAVTTSPGDPMSMLESRYLSQLPQPAAVERDADPAMKQMIAALRRSFGAGRLLQGGRWMKQVRAEPQAWMTAAADPVRVFYDKQETLFRKGRIGWGALVQADGAARAPGDGDLPAVVLYSEDDYFDARPAELASIGQRLLALRATGGVSEASRFAQFVRNDAGRPLGLPVPASVHAKEPVLSSVVAIRAHLPGGLLAGQWFPLLMHPSSVVPMIVPATFWPAALIAAWNERRLALEPPLGV
jgi:hypothetical protein